MTLRDLALELIRTTVACGFDSRASTLERVVNSIDRDESFDPLGRDRPWLEQAIESAFEAHAAAAATWPEVTDCDRLRRVFDGLDEAGIACFEACGWTLQDATSRVLDLVRSRDELSVTPSHGVCFFHRQDVEAALDGGLYLAFGALGADPLPGPPGRSVCPTCGGRGWVQPDEKRFPEPCPSHQPTVARPTRTRSERVGDDIVAQCREAGFEVSWSGSTADRISLPQFRWQRRRAEVTEAEVVAFLESWALELRAGPNHGAPVELVIERALDWFSTSPTPGPVLFQRLQDFTVRFLEAERAREATWTSATPFDALLAAFDALEAEGVRTSVRSGGTLLDGWAAVHRAARAGDLGVVFFHDEDVIDATRGEGLWLAFAAVPVADAEWESRTEAVGRRVATVLRAHGLDVAWSGAAHERLRVRGIEWQRRRFTERPPVSRVDERPFTSTHAPPPASIASPRTLGEVVVARVDESGFDLRRSDRLRSAWRAAGRAHPGQVGSLGRAMAFVRAGESTTVVPVAAAANLPVFRAEVEAIAAVPVAAPGT